MTSISNKTDTTVAPAYGQFEPVNRKRKVKEENRMFNPSWELEFLFTMPGDKSVCLLCQNSVADLKKANLQRHFTYMHNNLRKIIQLVLK